MWVDVIVEDVLASRPAERYLINDAWSPSGPVHVGSLRGIILHDCITRALRDAGREARFLYGFDDYDPLDTWPGSRPPDHTRYLGMPLSEVPYPDDGMSFGRHYGLRFAALFARLSVHPEFYWTSEMYKAGQFNAAIRVALDRAEELIQIDREISGSQKADRHPVQVVCENCGRIGTTVIVGWDGQQVTYECRLDKVTWAQGCGHRGARSPFDGGSKLTYKFEWAAKWPLLTVTIEGAGKDHMTRGGSHDVASAVTERIFHYPTPYAIAYEFILLGGRRMSSSRAVGISAEELVALIRPELVRFLMIRPHYRQQINFDPRGEAIPLLYDEYDRAADAYFGTVSAATPAEAEALRDLARTFHFSWTEAEPPQCFRMRFSKIAYLMQIPSVDLEAEAEKEKGAPLTELDRTELSQRVEEARRWLEAYAPEHYRFEVKRTLPAIALTAAQRALLGRLAELIAQRPWPGDELHARIHTLKTEMGLSPKDAFAAIYLAFLGKPSGPQAGWFLAALDRDLVLRRLREASELKLQDTGPKAS